jgi:hypothetical protein
MALARYFSKDVLALKQVLNKGSVEDFEQLLNQQLIEIAYDDDIETIEGQATMDLLIRLTSRLYPNICFTALGTMNRNAQFDTAATQVNSLLTVDSNASVTARLIIGKTKHPSNDDVITYYVGSDGWTTRISNINPVGSSNSANPFSAGIAACIGVANIFRVIFKDLLVASSIDNEFEFDLLYGQSKSCNGTVQPTELGEIYVVGLGAIGNGFAWPWSFLKNQVGKFVLVDPEKLSLSNLQRYVCALESDVDSPKADVVCKYLQQSGLECEAVNSTWAKYSNASGTHQELIIAAVDSAKDRIGIQSSLPKMILNGFTENGVSGVTRHLDFKNNACLVCGFLPEKEARDYSQEVADVLQISALENQIRHYIYYNFAVDDQLISWIANANRISEEDLQQFKGMPFANFYSDAVCGGVLLTLTKSESNGFQIEAPLAFQSALVGIILAANVVLLRNGKLNSSHENVFQYYPLQKMRENINPYQTMLAKDKTGRCICQDDDYLQAYGIKWL